MTLQTKFATIVEKIEALKEKYQNSLNGLETLYGALSQKAFKGELDLSRIPITKALKPKDIAMDVPQVEKPDLADQDEPVKTTETREQILHRLFHGFISDARTGALPLDDFWRTAEETFTAVLDEEAYPLGSADYDRVRDWLFDLLAKGSVVQVFNEEKNRMEIRPVS
jgi:type I restriction enzyme S subunit